MPLLLVRHAWAGKRDTWEGDDRLRPLDERGRRQAEDLVAQLVAYPVERILASPFLRCIQTVAPLAAARGVEVEAREELGEELQDTAGAALVRELAGAHAIVCGHGGLDGTVADAPRWKKGATFVLGADLELIQALPPP